MKVSLATILPALFAAHAIGSGMANKGVRNRHRRAAVKSPMGHHGRDQPLLVATLELGDNSTVSFYSVRNDTLVMSASIAKDADASKPINRLLLEGHGTAKKDTDPVKLYQKLAGSDAVPDELVQAWDKVQGERASKAQVKTMTMPEGNGPPAFASKPVRAESAYQHRRMQSATGDWWSDSYCADYGLVTDTCECYEYLTGDYASAIETEQLRSFIYVESGRVGQGLAVWEYGEWTPIAYELVTEGNANILNIWGAYSYYGAFAKYAWNDVYHWSMYALENPYYYDDAADDYYSGTNACWNTNW